MRKIRKQNFRFRKKKFGSDTEIGPWIRFPILKPSFGRTLVLGLCDSCTSYSKQNLIRKTSSLLSQCCPTIQIRKMRTRHAIWTILLQQARRNILGHMSPLILADTLTLHKSGGKLCPQHCLVHTLFGKLCWVCISSTLVAANDRSCIFTFG